MSMFDEFEAASGQMVVAPREMAPPAGWLACDGSPFSQEQYPALRENAAPEEPQAFQPERPIDEPAPATAPESVVEPNSSPARDSKPSTAE